MKPAGYGGCVRTFTATLMSLFALAPASGISQNTTVLWGTFDQGFGIPASSRTMVKSAAGQPFIGFSQSTGTWHEAGFLVDTLLRGFRAPSGPLANFRRTYGGSAADRGYSLVQTPDKGFIIAGASRSFQPVDEAYLVKTSDNGAVQWQRTFHVGDRQAECRSVTRTSDGGYAVAGVLMGNGTIFTAPFLAKLNAVGDTTWTHMYGGSASSSQSEVANGIQQTGDGGYILAGSIGQKLAIIRTNTAGDTLWTKQLSLVPSLAGSAATSVQLTSDGGYIVVGWAQAPFIINIQLIKLNSGGGIQWTSSFGGMNEFSFSGSVQQTIDGGYIISGNYAQQGGGSQAYLIKTNGAGILSWSRKYFAPGNNMATSVTQTFDGGYVVTGATGPNVNVQDAFLLKTNASGDSAWATIIGGGGLDLGRSVVQTDDGGYAFTGETNSFGAGNFDMWLVKSDENGTITGVGKTIAPGSPESFALFQNYPNPFNPSTTINYDLPATTRVGLRLYNILGQEVRTMVDEVQSPGHHSVRLDARNLASGVYFYRLDAASFVAVKKLLLLK